MNYFPFFMPIDNKKVLIVGGGRIAEHKLKKICMFTADITLIAEEFLFDVTGLYAIHKSWEPGDLDGFDVCIAATDDRAVNRQIGDICHEKNILVNVVDDREACDFIFPAMVKRGDVTVAISTNGVSPGLAKELRIKAEKDIPEDIAETAREMGQKRHQNKITIATRGSALAMAQTEIVKKLLEEQGVTVDIKQVVTTGDKDRKSALSKIGGRGVFVKEVERALLDGEADIAVHSGKDLPSELADGLIIAATPRAGSDRDMLISTTEKPHTIGTGSLRRIEQLKKVFPYSEFKSIRGNLDTRIKKLRSGEVDAIVVAQAGVERLDIDTSDLYTRVFTDDECLPAATQGIIAIECLKKRKDLIPVLDAINDKPTFKRFKEEREIVRGIGADCTTPLAVRCYPEDNRTLVRNMTPVEKLKGMVYITGAGPSYDLLTLRAESVIKKADVIVYDDLIDKSILAIAEPGTKLISVGKRLGSHKATQDEINSLIVGLAESGRVVVRLKGGDPYVFGRGGEEAEALKEAGADFEVIPGISTAIAVPEHFGIPVTNRGTARTFSVTTGHTCDGSEAKSGSRIYLMGMTHLHQIVEQLLAEGLSADTPAAVMSRAFSSNEKVVRGTLSDIEEKAEGLAMPGIIFVGDNAALDFSRKRKRTVTVTGTESFCERGRKALEEAGFEVKTLSHLFVTPRKFAQDFSEKSILVFTSANGVEVFFKGYSGDIRSLASMQFAVIGQATANALAGHGIYPDITPEKYSSDALADEIISQNSGEKVYLLRAENGSPVLFKKLVSAGIDTENRVTYDISVRQELLKDYVCDTDFIVFGSANGVKTFEGGGASVGSARVICIGAIAAKAYGKQCIVPEKADFNSIVEAIRS